MKLLHKSVTTLVIVCGVLSSGCGRSIPSQAVASPETAIPASPTVSVIENILQQQAQGTFEQPTAGVKVTSANTVIAGATQQDVQATQATPVITQKPAAAATKQVQPNTQQTYVVKKGDTVSVIANVKYGIKIAELLAVNDLTDKDVIKPGQTLIIPSK